MFSESDGIPVSRASGRKLPEVSLHHSPTARYMNHGKMKNQNTNAAALAWSGPSADMRFLMMIIRGRWAVSCSSISARELNRQASIPYSHTVSRSPWVFRDLFSLLLSRKERHRLRWIFSLDSFQDLNCMAVSVSAVCYRPVFTDLPHLWRISSLCRYSRQKTAIWTARLD